MQYHQKLQSNTLTKSILATMQIWTCCVWAQTKGVCISPNMQIVESFESSFSFYAHQQSGSRFKEVDLLYYVQNSAKISKLCLQDGVGVQPPLEWSVYRYINACKTEM